MLNEYLYLAIAMMYFIIVLVSLYEMWEDEHHRTTKHFIYKGAYIGLVIFYVLLWREHWDTLLHLKK